MKILLHLIILALVSTSPAFGQNALNFDGVNDHVLTTVTGVTGSSARTIEARIKTTANALPAGSGGTGQKVIVDWGSFTTGGRCTFNLLWSNAIRLEVGGNGINGTIPVNDGNWHHVACVIDPTAPDLVSLYVDGVLDIAGTPTVTMNTGTTNKIRIGQRIDNINTFEGEIDEVRVWNVARTQAELVANMTNELCNLPSSLILYCTMNEGVASGTNTTVTNATDYSPSNGSCALTGFGLTGATSNWVTGFAHGPGFIIGGSTPVSTCGTYTWPVNGQFYPNSGFYQSSVLASTGCDSIIGINLTVNTNTFATQNVTECESYTWPLTGQTYTTSGVQSATIPNAAGCDSIISLVLTITGPVFGIDDVIACEQYTWPVNGTTYFGTTSAVDTIPSSMGCDSIVSLNLTIIGPTFATQTITSCGDYYWPVDSMTYSTSGTWDATLTNSMGCDSVVTLDLTIFPFDISVVSPNPTTITANQSGAQYQWIDCSTLAPLTGETNQTFTASSAGSYAVIITLNNCSDTSICTNLSTAGLSEIGINQFQIAPNPTNGIFEVSSSSIMDGEIQVFDLQGKLIYSEQVDKGKTHKMNITHLNRGLYFVRVQSENNTEALRLIKK